MSSLLLFHGSLATYRPGEVVGPFEQTLFSERQKTVTYESRIEELLASHRIAECVSRQNACFACERPEHCASYLQSEQRRRKLEGSRHYFSVSMECSTRHPMVLTGFIGKHLDGPPDVLLKIAAEYWHPTGAWRFWEHMGQTMTISEEIPEPEDTQVTCGIEDFAGDVRRAKKRWPVPKTPT